MESRDENNDWIKLKQYCHIGLRFRHMDRSWISKYVSDVKKIETHSFLPFIHRNVRVRKFRKELLKDGSRSEKRVQKEKKRDIYYASHLDAQVYGYYSQILMRHYEQRLDELGIGECVTAYRRIKHQTASRNKCNIDFAEDIFSYIKNQAPRNLVAITFDIKSFFDSLNHKKLKSAWRSLLKQGSDLPSDHYNVFRNITKFSFTDETDLFRFFKDRIVVERTDHLRHKAIDRVKYLRGQRAVAYCYDDEVSSIRSHGLINSNKYFVNEKGVRSLRKKGIPQGSPISAVLANVYMIAFDKKVNDFLRSINGLYRRYSDDMIVVCDVNREKEILNFFNSEITEHFLEIQPDKTQVFHFVYDDALTRYKGCEMNFETGKLQNNTTFEYLGFQFDGKFTMLKSSSLATYYRKMKRAFARSLFYASHNKTTSRGKLFKNRLYKRFTFIGAERRQKYIRREGFTNQFVVSHHYDWGNYLSYARMAARIMSDNKIDGQIKRHWNIFGSLMKRALWELNISGR